VPRLDVLLARNLGLSRSVVARLLGAGRVCDEAGRRLDDGRTTFEPAALPYALRLDGQVVVLRARMDLLQHKPLDHVTALRDVRHATAYDLLADAPLRADLRAVGRLDIDSTGLLLWTTDGALLHRLTHPRQGVPRTYHVALGGPWSPPPADFALTDGHVPTFVALEARAAEQMHPGLVAPPNTRTYATITLTSGRFHEVRRIFAELDTLVLGLCRVRYGAVALPPELAAGAWLPFDPAAVVAAADVG